MHKCHWNSLASLNLHRFKNNTTLPSGLIFKPKQINSNLLVPWLTIGKIDKPEASKFNTPIMSNPPAPSPLEHRVSTVTTLLADYICKKSNCDDAREEELQNILDETLWEAREDILQRPKLQVPWSERLSTFCDIHRAGARARQTMLSRLIFEWLGIFIDMPVFLLFNITQVRIGIMWALKLVVRLVRCSWAQEQQSKALKATIRDRAQQQLPGLTDQEAENMAAKITLLAIAAAWLGVHGE